VKWLHYFAAEVAALFRCICGFFGEVEEAVRGGVDGLALFQLMRTRGVLSCLRSGYMGCAIFPCAATCLLVQLSCGASSTPGTTFAIGRP